MEAVFANMDDIDALISDVGKVQKELERFGAERMVDANEVYELLENNSLRRDRVHYVATFLLVSLGLRSNFDEDVINVTVEYDNNSASYDDLDILDLSDSDFGFTAESNMQYFHREKDKIVDNRTAHAEDQTVFKVNVCPFGNVLQSKGENSFEVDGMAPTASSSSSATAAADASKNESYIVLDTAIESSNTTHNLEPSNSHAISVPTNHNDNFMCDVNNNDPNNNTEYEVPLQAEDRQEQHDSTAREIDESGVEFEDQDDIRCQLLKEAVVIHKTVPRQNLEQIYSYLETNLHYKNRMQIVMQEFIKMDSESDPCAADLSDIGTMGNKSEVVYEHGRNVPETQGLCMPQPCTSSVEESDTVRKNCTITNTHLEPQPSTSKMNRKILIPNYSYPSTSRSTQVNEMGVALNENSEMKVEQDELSLSIPSSKECNTSLAIQPTTDSVNTAVSSAADIKLDIWEVSSTSTSDASTDLNHRATDNIRKGDVTSTANYNIQSKPIASVGPTLKTDISESSEHGWEDARSLTSLIDVYAIGRKRTKSKRESLDEESSLDKISRLGDTDQSNLLTQRKVAADEILLTPNQLKYKSLLMEMFPDADPQYLQQQCQTLQTEESVLNKVTELLEGVDYPHRQTLKEACAEPLAGPSVSDEDRCQMHFDTLVAILPNADPTYLQEACEKIGSDENAMKNFVTHALETKQYPTRDDYIKRQEALELEKKYTENFSIESFLEILPDPFKYFLEEKKNHIETEYALSYLKRRYRRITCKDLKKSLAYNHGNLTLTCQELDSFVGILRRGRRPEYECSFPRGVNIPFLQEVAFIENRVLIQDYLKDKADRKKRAFEEAKAHGALLECGCCFDSEVMLEDMAACNADHLFCKECVRKGAEVQIGNGKTTFPCLSECVAEFSLKTLQTVLKPSVFSRMLQRKQLEEVRAAGIEDLETCPFCDFATIPPSEDKVFHCLNPECMRESCRKCKEPNHIPLRCHEVEKSDEVKARTYIEDRMTEALVRTCWKCGKKFIKEDGCNKMRCTCGAEMCYICRQPVKDYSHFSDRGNGASDKCPLYSTNDDIHVEPVREEAKKAKKEMETKNPQLKLKHDPTQILPRESGLSSHHYHQYRHDFNHHHDYHRHDFHHHHYNHRHYHHRHHHQHLDNFPGNVRLYVGEPHHDVGMHDRFNRARHGIQMAVRMVAGEVTVAYTGNRDHQHPPRQHVPNQNPLPPANQD